MPEKIQAFTCLVCGAMFEQEGHARVCEKSHLDPKELKIKRAVTPENEEFAYQEEEAYPKILVINHQTRSNEDATYILQSYLRRRPKKPIRPRN